MGEPIRVLIVDDCEDDAVLLIHELRRGGYEPVFMRVETGDGFIKALDGRKWDIVAIDYSLPAFSGMEALKILDERGSDTPAIMVSGQVGETAAVEAMRAGACDFVPKSSMARLVPIVRRELLEAEIRRENKKTEIKLLNAYKETETILESVSAFLVSVDGDNVITRWNSVARSLLGFISDEMVGKSFSRLDSIWDGAALAEAIARVRKSGDMTRIEYLRYKRADGADGYLGMAISPVFHNFYKQLGFVLLGRDVTSLKRAEEEAEFRWRALVEAEKLATLGVLVASVAHEVNNPNNFIMLNVPLITDAWRDITPILDRILKEEGDFQIGGLPYSQMRESMPTLLKNILEGSRRINAIVAKLRNYGRRQSDEAPAAVNINEIAQSAASVIQNLINKSTDNFFMSLDDGIPPVRGNFQELEQVIINLLTNACAALDGKKKMIHVTTHHDGETGNVKIEVEDEGTGISKENISRIAEPFFTTKGQKGGMGLGLAISSGIIKRHGGTMEFVSEPGRGTTVTITLPMDNSKPG